MIQAPEPPKIRFFRNLPSEDDVPLREVWGIYVLVLTKPGETPLIYVGSSTDAAYSMHTRFRCYDRYVAATTKSEKEAVGVYIKAALAKGYKIVRKGILIWCRIPAGGKRPRIVAFMLAAEATLAFLVWAMYSASKDYGIAACCPWKLDSFSYRGLSNHSALRERPRGDFNLTEAQLQQITDEAKQAALERNRVNVKVWTKLQKDTDHEGWLLKQRISDKKRRDKDPTIHRAKNKKQDDRNKNLGRFDCKTCKMPLRSQQALDKHKASPSHKKRKALVKRGVKFGYQCRYCGTAWVKPRPADVRKHENSKTHKLNKARVDAAEAEAAAAVQGADLYMTESEQDENKIETGWEDFASETEGEESSSETEGEESSSETEGESDDSD